MVDELLFSIKKAWVENNMICLLMTDHKEIRFPVEANKKLKNATDEQRSNIEIIYTIAQNHENNKLKKRKPAINLPVSSHSIKNILLLVQKNTYSLN
jgi:hypothetical protein